MANPQKIAIISLKGGVAKTTSAVNIAACLAESGKKTLLIDIDPHTGASLHLGYDPRELDITIADVLINPEIKISDIILTTDTENLFLAPSNDRLANFESELDAQMGRENILSETLAGQIDDYDFVIIDSPPTGSFLLFSVLKASNFALIPFSTRHMSVIATHEIVELINKVQRRINPDLKILGFMATMFDQNTKESQQSFDEMQKKFGESIFQTVIPTTTTLAQAARKGTSILNYDRSSKGAIAYQSLVKEMLARIG